MSSSSAPQTSYVSEEPHDASKSRPRPRYALHVSHNDAQRLPVDAALRERLAHMFPAPGRREKVRDNLTGTAAHIAQLDAQLGGVGVVVTYEFVPIVVAEELGEQQISKWEPEAH